MRFEQKKRSKENMQDSRRNTGTGPEKGADSKNEIPKKRFGFAKQTGEDSELARRSLAEVSVARELLGCDHNQVGKTLGERAKTLEEAVTRLGKDTRNLVADMKSVAGRCSEGIQEMNNEILM